MNILIADDEPLARERIRSLVAEIGSPWRVVDEVGDGLAVVERCAVGDIDLILLDIRMPGLDGLEAAASLLDLKRPPAVIFTTAYSECALDAFEHHAVDYLLKPVRRERLKEALNKARNLSRVQLKSLTESRARELENQSVCVRYRGELRRIDLAEILFFRAEAKYVVVRHLEGEALLEESLKSLEQRFSDRFIRIHRNALINLDFMAGMKKDEEGQYVVELKDQQGVSLEVSRRHLPAVRQWLRGSKT
jgi:two-component system, LytTR family, response regulator AlgR